MSVGYALLLSTGAMTPLHKTRGLVDSPVYRGIWRAQTGQLAAVIIVRAKRPEGKPDRHSACDDEFPHAF